MTLGAAAVILAACSTGDQQAEQACVHVARSITLYNQSLHQKNETTAADEQRSAQKQLQIAEPLAADATSANGQWNGLQTTLIESERVSEGNLLVALQSECAGVVTGGSSPKTTNSGPTLPPGA